VPPSISGRDLRGSVAIVGVAESNRIGIRPDASALTLHAEAAKNALADAGLGIGDVDGLFTAGVTSVQLGEYLGIVPRYSDGTSVGGCSFIIHVEHAMLALEAGIIKVALITHGESGRSRIGGTGAGHRGIPPDSPQGQFEAPFGTMGPPTLFSLPATRHMHQYGTTREQMAEVAVSTRRWAAMHPMAMMKEPITVEDVMASRPVCWPYSLFMCCLVTDAGGAVVMTRADMAKQLARSPVYVLGTGEGTEHNMVSMMADMTSSQAARLSGKAAFDMAGVSHAEIDVAQLYDAFAFTPMLALEDLGFVAPGESGPFVEGGRTGPGGDFPMNTNGGGLSYTHPGMYGIFTVVEAVRQLRGEVGDRQVNGCETALAHGTGGSMSSTGTVVLATG